MVNVVHLIFFFLVVPFQVFFSLFDEPRPSSNDLFAKLAILK
jgi:hypothetical protein